VRKPVAAILPSQDELRAGDRVQHSARQRANASSARLMSMPVILVRKCRWGGGGRQVKY
jgi:hypothetical protein